MIKNLLDADAHPPEGVKVTTEETIIELPTVQDDEPLLIEPATADAENVFEIPVLDYYSRKAAETSETAQAERKFQSPGETFFDDLPKPENETPVIYQTEHKPESTAETMRNSGLAYAAAITLFAAVVFMMVVGWGADLLLGTSPWGIVGGIVLGAVIGFVQFFRLTSQILKDKD